MKFSLQINFSKKVSDYGEIYLKHVDMAQIALC